MKFHWGKPRNKATLRFERGTTSTVTHVRTHGHQHHVEKWYGISFGSRCFIGITFFNRTEDWISQCVKKPKKS